MEHIHWYPGHIAKAEKKLKESINQKRYIDTAKEQAEELFKTIFESQGYSVEIVWMENSDGNN